jgi:hypothetical protein
MSGSGSPGRVRTRDEDEVSRASVARQPAWSARSWLTARPFPNDLRRAGGRAEGVVPARHPFARHK